MQRTQLRVHKEDGTFTTIARVIHFDDKTNAWYAVIDGSKVYAYWECDETADTYLSPYSREHYTRYGLIENAQVRGRDGIARRQSVQYDRETKQATLLDGVQVTYDHTSRCYVTADTTQEENAPDTVTTQEESAPDMVEQGTFLNQLKHSLRACYMALTTYPVSTFSSTLEAHEVKHELFMLLVEARVKGLCPDGKAGVGEDVQVIKGPFQYHYGRIEGIRHGAITGQKIYDVKLIEGGVVPFFTHEIITTSTLDALNPYLNR